MLYSQNCKIVISVTLSMEISLTENNLVSESIFISQSCIGISMKQECYASANAYTKKFVFLLIK